MEAAAIAQYGAGIDTSNSSPLGKSIRATAVEIANRWNADRGVYYAAYIDFAYGTNLDACIAILNLPRKSAVYSTGEVVFTGTDSTLVPGNTVLTNPDLIRFKTTRDMTIADVVTNGGFPSATTGWVAQNGAVLASVAGGSVGNCLEITGGGAIADPYADQTYTVIPGDIYDLSVLINDGTEATYNVTVYDETNSANIYTTGDLEETAGDWSTSATTQLTIPTDCVSASIRVQQIALAAATTTMLFDTVSLTRVGVSMKAIVAGTTGNAAADTIVLLESPISGITAVTNPSAVTGGTDKETDSAYRSRAKTSQSASGKAIYDAVYSAILAVTSVTAVDLVENDTSGTVDGVPAHAFKPTIVGGDDDDLAQAIFDVKPCGIECYGTTDSGIATRIDDTLKTINFNRPTDVPIYIDVTVVTDSTYPTDGDTLVETAVMAYIGGTDSESVVHFGLGIGDDVIFREIESAAFGVVGITDVAVNCSIVDTDPVIGSVNVPIASSAKASATVTAIDIFAATILTGPGAVDPDNAITLLVTTGADALTLADGANNQRVYIKMITDGGAGTLTPTNLAGGTTLTFDDVSDDAALVFTASTWNFVGGTATLA